MSLTGMLMAWAVVLHNKNSGTWSVFCVFAETKNEAWAKALDECEADLKAERSKDKLEDYKISIWTYKDLPKALGLTPGKSYSSSFDDQIAAQRR